MKIGSTTIHPKYGQVEVSNVTDAMVCYKLADGTTRRERRPDSRRWRCGDRCWLVPDKEMPDVRVRGVVTALGSNKRPMRVVVNDNHPVWHLCEVDVTHGVRFGHLMEPK